MINTLKVPSMHKDLARVLQIWFQYPGAVRNFCGAATNPPEDITNYPQVSGACPKANKKRQDSTSVDPSFRPADAANAVVNWNVLGIRCLDNALRGATVDNYQTWYKSALKRSKYAADISQIGIQNCAAWKQYPSYGWPSSQPWPTDNKIDNKETILFVQTPYDTVTPDISAQNAASYYAKSRIVRTNGLGVRD